MGNTDNEPEFNSFAVEYTEINNNNIKITGEKTDFFAEYKIKDLVDIARLENLSANDIMDFGSGVGNSTPWFRKYFAGSRLTCADVSNRSLQQAQQKYPGSERYFEIQESGLSLPEDSFDIVFTACVFHHIPAEEHIDCFKQILRVTKPGGIFVIFEHNPWNPLTVHAVNTCPFDANAVLISAPKLKMEMRAAGWRVKRCWYRIFFPGALAKLRPLEKYLHGVCLGAQYCLVGIKDKNA